MEEIFSYIQENVAYAPFITFGLLLLAGLNLPISEDAMLFISGLLADQNPEKLVPLFLGVYLGAYGSDLIAYALGRFLGPRLWDIKYFKKMVGPEKINKLGKFYQRNGLLTLLIGRFIPFGVRNALFVTAGFSKMNFTKFAVFDLIAASISCGSYFYLYYSFGTNVIEYVKKGNIIFFALFITILVIYFYRRQTK